MGTEGSQRATLNTIGVAHVDATHLRRAQIEVRPHHRSKHLAAVRHALTIDDVLRASRAAVPEARVTG